MEQFREYLAEEGLLLDPLSETRKDHPLA
jgi:hypothetical protein